LTSRGTESRGTTRRGTNSRGIKSADATSTHESEPVQEDKISKSAVAASTQASEPAQKEKISKNVKEQDRRFSAQTAMTQSTTILHSGASLNKNNYVMYVLCIDVYDKDLHICDSKGNVEIRAPNT
jgi:hypothetical protein